MRTSELVPVARSEPTTAGDPRGVLLVLASPQMRLVLAIVTVVSTVGFNFHVILPLLASDAAQAGPEVFGILSASFGGGALVGALLSAALGRASWKVLVAGTGGFSLSLLALAPLTTVWACACSCSSPVSARAVDVECELDPAAAGSRPPARPGGQPLPLGLRRVRPVGGLLAGWLTDVGGTQLAFTVAGVTGPDDDTARRAELTRRYRAASVWFTRP